MAVDNFGHRSDAVRGATESVAYPGTVTHMRPAHSVSGQVLSQFDRFIRLGCTLGGSPGIFGGAFQVSVMQLSMGCLF